MAALDPVAVVSAPPVRNSAAAARLGLASLPLSAAPGKLPGAEVPGAGVPGDGVPGAGVIGGKGTQGNHNACWHNDGRSHRIACGPKPKRS